MLSYVTFTGWDRHTDIGSLGNFLGSYPEQSIEVAVLYSESRSQAGHDRYPDSGTAIKILRAAKAAGQRTAVHLCGDVALNLLVRMEAAPWCVGDLVNFADRVQVNVGEDFWPAGADKYKQALALSLALPRQVIVQTRDVGGWPSVEHIGPGADRMVAFLFDRSAGHGRSLLTPPTTGEPRSYPTPIPGRHVGYAGGLGPENVGEFLSRIQNERLPCGERYWIDMESGIREWTLPDVSIEARGLPSPIVQPSHVSLMKCQHVMGAASRYLEVRQ